MRMEKLSTLFFFILFIWLVSLMFFQSITDNLLYKIISYAELLTLIVTVSAMMFAYIQWVDSIKEKIFENIINYKSELENRMSQIPNNTNNSDKLKYNLVVSCIVDFLSKLNIISNRIDLKKDEINYKYIFNDIFSSKTVKNIFKYHQTKFPRLSLLYKEWNIEVCDDDDKSSIDLIYITSNIIKTDEKLRDKNKCAYYYTAQNNPKVN